jgi:uncharacterized protein YdbL (DUF1318 family)
MSRKVVRQLSLIAAFLLALVVEMPAGAQAAGIDASKAAGQVGEKFDGYLGVVKADAPPATQQLVKDINAKRRLKYQELAQRNGVLVDEVAKIAGKNLVNRAPPGQYVMPPSGQWVLKP